MNTYEAYRIFTQVAENLSFSRAAERLRIPKATVSTTIQDLEERLGVRLLNRTTRRVALTPAGVAFLDRCTRMLADVDDAERMFRADHERLEGLIRVNTSVAVAADLILPALPRFLARYPFVRVDVSATDHRVDPVREGFDCVLRSGGFAEPGLVERELMRVPYVNCASPRYLETYGTPLTLADLSAHRLINYAHGFANSAATFEYVEDDVTHEVAMPSALTVDSTITFRAACLAGLGLIQAPRLGAARYLAEGQLVEVLPGYRARPHALKLVYPERRVLAKRVRVFMDWLEEVVDEVRTSGLSDPGAPASVPKAV